MEVPQPPILTSAVHIQRSPFETQSRPSLKEEPNTGLGKRALQAAAGIVGTLGAVGAAYLLGKVIGGNGAEHISSLDMSHVSDAIRAMGIHATDMFTGIQITSGQVLETTGILPPAPVELVSQIVETHRHVGGEQLIINIASSAGQAAGEPLNMLNKPY
jgi:hypothetical protein